MDERYPLGELVSVTQGVAIGRLRDPEGEIIQAIQIRNLLTLELAGEPEESQVGQGEITAYKVNSADVVVSLRGMPLKASVVTADQIGWVVTSNTALLRPRPTIFDLNEQIEPYYLAGILRSNYLRQQLSADTDKSETSAISVKALRMLTIPLPPKERQQSYAAAFKAHDRFTRAAQKISDLRTQRLELHFWKEWGDPHGH